MKKSLAAIFLTATLVGCNLTPSSPAVEAPSEVPAIRYKAEGCKGVMQIIVGETAYYYQIPKDLLCRSI